MEEKQATDVHVETEIGSEQIKADKTGGQSDEIGGNAEEAGGDNHVAATEILGEKAEDENVVGPAGDQGDNADTEEMKSADESTDEPIVMEVDLTAEDSVQESEPSVEEIESAELREEGVSEEQPEVIVVDPEENQETPHTESEGVEFVELDNPAADPDTVQLGDAVAQSNSEEESLGEEDVPDLERIGVGRDPGEVEKTETSSEAVEDDETVTINETDVEEVEVDLVELLQKKDVFLYEIPLENKSQSRKASEWNLNEPIWCGNLQLLSQGAKCVVKLEDEEQSLYGYAVVESYPSDELRPVTDSTRYFIIKFTKDNSDLNEPDTEEIVGMGFSDRKDSTDFTWTVVNYFKDIEKASATTSESKSDEQENEPTEDDKSSMGQPQVSKKRKSASDGSSEPVKKVMFQDQVPTSSSHIVIEGGDVEKYVKQGLKRPGIFPCHLCTATFDDMRHIKTHWHQVHELRHPAHCVDCHRPFPTAEKMVEHRDEVHGHKCPKCKRGFKLDRLLEAHFLSEHREKLEYRCSFCEEKYEIRTALKSHLEAVHPSSLVKCPECPPEKLFTEAELAAHTGAHEKYMFCHLCDAGFSTKGQLRVHMEANHVGAEPLKLL